MGEALRTTAAKHCDDSHCPTPMRNSECGMRNVSAGVLERRPFTSIPHSAFRTPHLFYSFRIPHSFPGARVESPIHHPRRAPLRRPVISPLLVRRLGHDRRYLRRHALLVERHVRPVAGIGVPPPTREHVLG